MNIIKLDAIDSTNNFLKKLNANAKVANFTVVSTKTQTNGRGQMGATWVSEPNKNLIMSILVQQNAAFVNQIFDFNVMIAVTVIEVLSVYKIPDLRLKWPNDIMAGNKKIGGILIENALTSTKMTSIVGIGINVNQTDFGNLIQASSLSIIAKIFFDVDNLVLAIAEKVALNFQKFSEQRDFFWQQYHSVLFKKDQPIMFENTDKSRFLGIIKEVSRNGKLVVLLENDLLTSFNVKQIKMLF